MVIERRSAQGVLLFAKSKSIPDYLWPPVLRAERDTGFAGNVELVIAVQCK